MWVYVYTYNKKTLYLCALKILAPKGEYPCFLLYYFIIISRQHLDPLVEKKQTLFKVWTSTWVTLYIHVEHAILSVLYFPWLLQALPCLPVKKERYILFWVQQVLKLFEFRGIKIYISTMPEHGPELCAFSLYWYEEAAAPNPEYWKISYHSQIGWEHGTTGVISFASLSISSLLNDIVTKKLSIFAWEGIRSGGHNKCLLGRERMTKTMKVTLADHESKCNVQYWTINIFNSIRMSTIFFVQLHLCIKPVLQSG